MELILYMVMEQFLLMELILYMVMEQFLLMELPPEQEAGVWFS